MDKNTLFLLALSLLLGACGGEEKKKDTRSQAGGTTNPVCSTAPDLALSFGLSYQADTTLAADRELIEAALPSLRDGFTTRIVNAYRSGGGVDASHVDFVQEFDGIALCGGPERAHVISGAVNVPHISRYRAPTPHDTEAFGDATSLMRAAALALNVAPESAILRSEERCYEVRERVLTPATELKATLGGAPYTIVGNQGGIRNIAAQSLHATATASVYKRNPLDENLVEAALEVSEDGHLVGPDFKVVDNFGEIGGPVATAGKFDVTPDQGDFSAVSLVAHAQEMLAFFKTYRTTDADDCLPIEIEPHAANGPVYLPSWNQSSEHPLIMVPDGDGKILQNLAVDFDAIAHELGHHFVYQNLKKLDHLPTRIIHEGMADFFVFAYTGDACLAESICPAGSNLCVVPGKCLRSGDPDVSGIKFYTEAYQAEPYHRQSQALSGMLLAMGEDPAIGKDAIIKSTFAAIDFLKPTSELADFLTALLSGDQAAFSGAHACRMLEIAKDFGLVDEAAAIDCNAYTTSQPPAQG